MMNAEDLKKIKAGDEIAISYRFDIALRKVIKVTPSGRIKINTGDYYNGNTGFIMGEHYHYSYIVPKEDYYNQGQKKKEVNEKKAIFDQISLNMRLTKDQLSRILAITKEVI